MPVNAAWDYRFGGSYGRAQEDIIAQIGAWPGKGWTLHIIEHDRGLVPGNLCWAGFAEQSHEQVRKIAARQRHEIKLLLERLAACRKKIRVRKRAR